MSDANVAAKGQAGVSRPAAPWVKRLEGMPGVSLAFLWGLAEGTFFFVVPDVPISLAAMLRPRKAWRHVVAAIVGSLVGGAVMFHWSAGNSTAAHDAVARVPFVRARMFDEVHASYQARGLGAVFLGPATGTPYKIYAVEAPEFLGRTTFLLGTIPARGERFLLVWAAFGVAGVRLRRSLQWSVPQLTLTCACFWVILYSCYWGMIVLR